MEDSRGFRRKIIGLSLIFAFITGSIFGAEDKWHTRKSYHFITYYQNCSQSFLDKLVDRAEECYREINQDLGFFRDQPWVWDKRADIYVYDSQIEYLKNTGMPAWSAGCARPLEKKVFTYADSYLFFQDTLTHELSHLVFREFVGDNTHIPLWLDEGVAVYVEKKKNSAYLKKQVKEFVEAGTYIPFAELMNLSIHNLGQSSVQKFYLQAWSILDYLIEKYDRFRFLNFLRRLKSGDQFQEAFFMSYRSLTDMEDFEKEWKKFYQ